MSLDLLCVFGLPTPRENHSRPHGFGLLQESMRVLKHLAEEGKQAKNRATLKAMWLWLHPSFQECTWFSPHAIPQGELLGSIPSEHSWKMELLSVSIASSTSTSSNCFLNKKGNKSKQRTRSKKNVGNHNRIQQAPLARRWSENLEAALSTKWIRRKWKKRVI